MLRAEAPDVVHVHNLYPLISPSVLEACKDFGVPVVMRCPNYRLICPTGVHLRDGRHCDLCAGGREYWCALTNCRGNWIESSALSLRSMVVRFYGLIGQNVDVFVPPSNFVKQRLIESGVREDRIRVIPNTVRVPENSTDPAAGRYVAFAGRLSEEKGAETVIAAAKRLPKIPFRIAGEGHLLGALQSTAPSNVEFVGQLDRRNLARFYEGARMAVVPSVWHEAFGLVAAEAMAHGLPVIASRMGALPEIVDEGETGILFDARDDEQLAEAIGHLWMDPELCRAMGGAGRAKVQREYTREIYYQRLLRVYGHALGWAETQSMRSPELARSA
jgi:glycosyltransferase involved in cell wall biosynthesis